MEDETKDEDSSEEYVFERYTEDEWQLLDSCEEGLTESHVEPDDLSSLKCVTNT